MAGEHHRNTTEHVKRPNIDILLLFKLLVLQSMYVLSNPEPERQADDTGEREKVPGQKRVRSSGLSDNLLTKLIILITFYCLE